MGFTRKTVFGIIGAIIAVLLQILLAPAITLFSAVPNFVIAYCIARAVAASASSGVVSVFVCALICDLVGSGPVGALPLVLVAVCYAASRLYLAFNNDTLFVPVVTLLVSVVLVELIYGIIVVVAGTGISFGQAFLYRILPCTLYDCVLCLLLYPILARVLAEKPQTQPGTPILR